MRNAFLFLLSASFLLVLLLIFDDTIISIKTDAAKKNEKNIATLDGKKNTDADNDGLTNVEEQNIYKTNSFDTDSDDDGLSDTQEVKGWIWYRVDSQGICGDFLKNESKEQVIGQKLCIVQKTDPLSQDTDQDGNSDFFEYNFLGAIATDADQDKDGLVDGQENGPNSKYHTSFLLYDTDGDGVSDGDEIKSGTNPLDPTDAATLPRSGDETGLQKERKDLPLYKIPPPTTAVNPPLVNPPISTKESKGNEPPKVFSKAVLIQKNTAREIALTASDPDGQDRITFFIRSNPLNGELGPQIKYIDRTTATIEYFPDKGFVGTDRITYWAFDGKDFSRENAIIQIVVIP